MIIVGDAEFSIDGVVIGTVTNAMTQFPSETLRKYFRVVRMPNGTEVLRNENTI